MSATKNFFRHHKDQMLARARRKSVVDRVQFSLLQWADHGDVDDLDRVIELLEEER